MGRSCELGRQESVSPTYTCVHPHITHRLTHLCVHLHTHKYVHKHTYTLHTHIYTSIYTHIHTHVHSHPYTHSYTHIHTYTHSTHNPRARLSCKKCCHHRPSTLWDLRCRQRPGSRRGKQTPLGRPQELVTRKGPPPEGDPRESQLQARQSPGVCLLPRGGDKSDMASCHVLLPKHGLHRPRGLGSRGPSGQPAGTRGDKSGSLGAGGHVTHSCQWAVRTVTARPPGPEPRPPLPGSLAKLPSSCPGPGDAGAGLLRHLGRKGGAPRSQLPAAPPGTCPSSQKPALPGGCSRGSTTQPVPTARRGVQTDAPPERTAPFPEAAQVPGAALLRVKNVPSVMNVRVVTGVLHQRERTVVTAGLPCALQMQWALAKHLR